MKRYWLTFSCLLALGAEAKTVTYSVSVGNNAPPDDPTSALTPLRYADDDAARYFTFFSRFADHQWLLSVLDQDTQARFPGVGARAVAPTLGALRQVIAEAATQMRQDKERGDESVLYFTYSGHGAQAADGSAFLALADGPLSRKVLYEEVLAALPATFIHLFVDACHADAVVGSRGLFTSEREGTTVRLPGEVVSLVKDNSSLRRFANVGALMAASADQESHEWSRIQSGLFTHEVLSGLTGAADVNADGLIEYSELQAFVSAANRDLPDPGAQPRIVGAAPALNPHVPIVSFAQQAGAASLTGEFSKLGRFHLEFDNGERYADANLAEGPRRLLIPPGRRVFLIAGEKEAEWTSQPREATALTALEFRPRSSSARGSIDSGFQRALFQSQYGPAYYRGFADGIGTARVVFAASEPEAVVVRVTDSGARQRWAAVTLGLAGVSLGTAITSTIIAIDAKRALDTTTLQRAAAEANARHVGFSALAITTSVSTVLFGIAAAYLWPPTEKIGLAPTVTSTSAGLSLGGSF